MALIPRNSDIDIVLLRQRVFRMVIAQPNRLIHPLLTVFCASLIIALWGRAFWSREHIRNLCLGGSEVGGLLCRQPFSLTLPPTASEGRERIHEARRPRFRHKCGEHDGVFQNQVAIPRAVVGVIFDLGSHAPRQVQVAVGWGYGQANAGDTTFVPMWRRCFAHELHHLPIDVRVRAAQPTQ